MSLGDKIFKQIFSETEDIRGVFEILSDNKIGDYEILDKKEIKSNELLSFLSSLTSQFKEICDSIKDSPMEIIANTSDYTFLIAPLGTDGSNMIVMSRKEGNIGLIKTIVHKTVAQYKS